MSFFLTESKSFKLSLSDEPGGYFNYSHICDDPYYVEYNQSNQEAILKLMKDRNISTVWLNIHKVNMKQWMWLSGEKNGK